MSDDLGMGRGLGISLNNENDTIINRTYPNKNVDKPSDSVIDYREVYDTLFNAYRVAQCEYQDSRQGYELSQVFSSEAACALVTIAEPPGISPPRYDGAHDNRNTKNDTMPNTKRDTMPNTMPNTKRDTMPNTDGAHGTRDTMPNADYGVLDTERLHPFLSQLMGKINKGGESEFVTPGSVHISSDVNLIGEPLVVRTDKDLRISIKTSSIIPEGPSIRSPWGPSRPQAREILFRFSAVPSYVLLIKRINTPSITYFATQMIRMLHERGVNVLVEPAVHEELNRVVEKRPKLLGSMAGILTWSSDKELNRFAEFVDFVLTLGGDGTVLWTSALFPQRVPPILPIACGSLSYFSFVSTSDAPSVVDGLLTGNEFKSDFRCRIEAKITDSDNNEVCTKPIIVLNEVSISRANKMGCVLSLDCYVNEAFLTTIAADGLIIATPTGSTAYSMSAGSSIVHPNLPAMLFTPICPHTLSIRPLVLHESSLLTVVNPANNFHEYQVFGDGQPIHTLLPGHMVHLRLSKNSISLIYPHNIHTRDPWLSMLTENLNWNMRVRQNPIRLETFELGDEWYSDECTSG